MKQNKKSNRKSHKNNPADYLNTMTHSKIMDMHFLGSQSKIRFLHDVRHSKHYVLLDGRTNQTYFTRSYQQAQRFFNTLVASC